METTNEACPDSMGEERFFFRPRAGESEEVFGRRLREGVLAMVEDQKREHLEQELQDSFDPEDIED